MKVLIIEDDREIIEAISLAFQIRWPEAKVVSTRLGEKGSELVESEAPDIVILDLGLPDMSGFDVLHRIRLFSDVPIIILTVRADEADVVKGLEWGADDYIVKPEAGHGCGPAGIRAHGQHRAIDDAACLHSFLQLFTVQGVLLFVRPSP